ncbi:MAG: glycosyltransferase [Syntrophales bacterium]
MAAAEDDAEYYALLGYGNEGLGFYKEAEEYADKALAISDGKSAPALNLKGVLAYRNDDVGKAEEFFQQAIEVDPGYGDPYTNMGMLRWKAEQKEEALDLIEKAFVLFPDKGDLLTAYFNAISAMERFGRAERIFREAMLAYPENKRVLFFLIDILLKQEKFQEAMKEIEKAMVHFGMDEVILSAALEIRRKIGPKSIAVSDGKMKAAPTLSVCMIVKNETRYLAQCLNSLSPVADEIIVVDTGSTDKTKEIAEAFGAHLYDFDWTNDFSAARNESLAKAKGDWILVMDADEVISFQDHAKLKKLINGKNNIAYNLVTRNYINKTAGDGWTPNDNIYINEQDGRGWFPSGKIRLFPNHDKIRFENPIHELVEHSVQKMGFSKQESGIPVHHYGELDAKKSSLKDAQYYELGVQKMKESGGDVKSVWELAVQSGELGKYEESIELWHKFLEFKQKEATAYFNLASHYLKLGKHEESYDCSRKSYALDPNDQSAVLSYAMAEFLAGDINTTISVLEGFLKGTDSQTSLVGLLAASFLVSGEKDKGLKYLRGLVKKKYDCVYYLKNLAESLIGAGNLARAKVLLTAAIEIKFFDQETAALLGKCDDLAKSRHTGENQCPVVCNTSESLDSGLHRNDDSEAFSTFDESSTLSPQFQQKDAIAGMTSIVIPVESIHLNECLSSIKQYTDKPHEILLLDSGAASKLKKQYVKAIKENSNYKVIKIDRGVSFTKALNEGINQTTGEYIVLLFDDVVVCEGWLSDMLEFLNRGKKIGIVGAMSDNASALQRAEGIDFKSPDERSSFRERNRHRRILTRNLDGFCMLFRRDLLIQVGIFDETLGQDKYMFDDFCVRAVLEGYNNIVAGNVFVHNRGGIDRLLSRDKTLFDEKWIGLDASTLLADQVLIINAIELARSQYHKGDIVDAVKTLIARIGFSPNERRLFYQIADILLAENKFQEALDALRGMAVAEDDAEYYALLGYCNEGLGFYKEAEEYGDKALAIDGNSAPALNLKGILAFRKADVDKAEGFFKRAMEANPGYGDQYTNLGMLRWKTEQKEEALDLVEKAFILFPDKSDLVTAYYNVISSVELYGRAENIFREARSAYPENKRILFLLIDILLKQGKFQEAMKEVEKAMVQFGMDIGILAAALEIRRKIGPKSIADKVGKATAAPRLSICMIVKNEEQHLAYCLNSLSPVADEMIVVDTGSTDKTKEIAEAFGAQIFDIEWTNDFAVARNHSLSKAKGDWILVMDADEVISFQDHAKLKKLINRKDKVAYNIVTRNYIDKTAGDGWVCNDNTYIHEQAGRGWYPSGKVRLFPNNEKIRFENPVHELVEYSIQRIGMSRQESGIPVHHYGELDKKKATEKDVQYYDLGVQKMKESGGDFKSVWELAVQAGELGKLEESIELWHKVLGFKQREAAAYFNMANHYLHLARYEESYDCSRKAYALDPQDQSSVLTYAMSEFLAGDINKTITALEVFLKGTDTQTSHVGLLAVSCLLAGEKDRGLKYLRGLVKKKYNCVYYFKDLSQSLIAAGNLARAKSLLTAAIEIKFYDQETSALLAKCEVDAGSSAGS